MRRLLSPALLALSLLMLAAFPARAGGFHVSHGVAFHRFAHVRTFATFRHFRRFGAGSFVGPFFWDWADDQGAPISGGSGPMVIVLNLAPPEPVAPPTPARATIETSHGVTVVRGPGTLH